MFYILEDRYVVVEDPKTYDDARANCEAMGRKLFEPKSAESNDEVISLARDNNMDSFWIGVDDLAQEGDFTYESDETSVTYTDWEIGMPDNYLNNEHCVQIFNYGNVDTPNYKWNDQDCNAVLKSICEKTETGKQELGISRKCQKAPFLT